MSARNADTNGRQPTVISTFAGCGGSSLGYKMAGFKELAAVEYWDIAAASFKANFPDVQVLCKDIRTVKGTDLLDMCSIKPGGLSVLDGSPPCQGFSTATRNRKVADERNDLFLDYIRLIKVIKPQAFIMENVTGMAKGAMRGRFNEVLRELKKTGYKVVCRKLNAMWYNVPQSRERLFFVGMRQGVYTWPNHTVKQPVTVSQALDGCIPLTFKHITPNTKSHRIMCALVPGKRLPAGEWKDCIGRLHPNKPSPTIKKSLGSYSFGAIHPNENRRITIEEVKRLCSFPDDYILKGTFEQQWAQLGNSVMPLQMKAIAESLRKVLS